MGRRLCDLFFDSSPQAVELSRLKGHRPTVRGGRAGQATRAAAGPGWCVFAIAQVVFDFRKKCFELLSAAQVDDAYRRRSADSNAQVFRADPAKDLAYYNSRC